MRVFIQHGTCSVLVCKGSDNVINLKSAIERELGVCYGDQCLIHAAQLMQDSKSLSEYGVSHNSTIHLNTRLRGGAKGMQLVVKPRIQKDRWSNYWKESMETKTDMESDINLTVHPTMTVGEVQKEVEKRMGWGPTSQLQRMEGFKDPWESAVFRMEGFKDPWESAVFKGRLVVPDKTLQDCGISTGDMLICVRRVLVPEGWRIIREGEESDDSSSDEDW